MAKKGKKNKRGRRWFDGKDTTEVKKKLEEAYSNALPFTEALIYCGISKSSLSRYLASNPAFRERLQQLRRSLNIKARAAIAKALNEGDIAVSRWWLEHKDEDFKRTPSTKKATASVTRNEEGDVDKVELVLIDTPEKKQQFENEKDTDNNSISEGL